VAGACENDNESMGSINCANFFNSYGTISFSRTTLLHGVSDYSSAHSRSPLIFLAS
jgi:hypothetical protein